jgi:hypothetical protein
MFERERHAPGAIGRARRLRSDMKPAEQKLWKELRKLDSHIRRQVPIGPYMADFACHSKRLVIEVDGEIHERVDEVVLRDHERAERLRGQGASSELTTGDHMASAPNSAFRRGLALPPQSPTLSPSRGKGE